jgi:hypothetical protein
MSIPNLITQQLIADASLENASGMVAVSNPEVGRNKPA